MPDTTILEMPLEEQAQMLAALRRGRYGALLTLHILLLCARGHTPTEIAWWLFCSRSSVYRTVQAYRAGTLRCRVEEDGHLSRPGRTTALTPALRRWLLTLLQVGPRSYGWCRTRWSCAALAAELKAKRHLEVSAETIRRWLHEVGWVWKRAKLVAKDDDPQRTERLARIRWVWEHLRAQEILVFADELDIHLLPKVGCEWMPKGTQVTVMTPGTNAKHYLAGALDPRTGTLLSCDGERKTSGLFLALLNTLEGSYARAKYRRISVGVDNYTMHKAQAVTQWLTHHERFTLLFLPTYCPRANPIERAFGDVHDKCTRNHKRTRLQELVWDVQRHLRRNGPWKYQLSELYYAPEITAAMETIAADEQRQAA